MPRTPQQRRQQGRQGVDRTVGTQHADGNQGQYQHGNRPGRQAEGFRPGTIDDIENAFGPICHRVVEMLVQHAFCHLQKIVEIQKIPKAVGKYQQSGVPHRGRHGRQGGQLRAQKTQHLIHILRQSHRVVDLPLDMNALGKGAEIEPDHRTRQPPRGVTDKGRRRLR